MEIRDSIHGAIPIQAHEWPVLETPFFLRLRQIKQLGFAEYSFPGATHTRYIHSLGAMHVASRAFDEIFPASVGFLEPEDRARLRHILRFAALVHDIGHGPLSHTSEFAMPPLSLLNLPPDVFKIRTAGNPTASVQASHEDYTLKILLQSELGDRLNEAGRAFGFTARHVASLIEPAIPLSPGERQVFNVPLRRTSARGHKSKIEEINLQPLLHQLISSELDADRMDYLRRDSFFTGVSYGHYDFEWMCNNLTFYVHDAKAFLALEHRALFTFEDFLLSRFHMFLMVYLHKRTVIYDRMLREYLQTCNGEYQIPSDLADYITCNDGQLLGILSQSQNDWARRMIRQQPYRLLIEQHSGIKSQNALGEVRATLDSQRIHYLEINSTGELSKYSEHEDGAPIYVRYDDRYNPPSFVPLRKCTELFDKYPAKRTVSRLYVSPEDFPRLRRGGQTSRAIQQSEEL